MKSKLKGLKTVIENFLPGFLRGFFGFEEFVVSVDSA